MTMIRIWLYILVGSGVACCLNSCQAPANQQSPHHAPSVAAGTEILVGFYNVENLFDTQDDPHTDDDDFTPSGRYEWTQEKYEQKLTNLAKAISSIGKEGPHLLGLAEIEDQGVLQDLVSHALLAKRGYQIVHDESPDGRGIDVGFIYDPNVFSFAAYRAFQLHIPSEPRFKTREVLRIAGAINDVPLYILVNHWPSRREGREESEPRRVAAAELNQEIYREICTVNPDPCVMIMGDFNDDPYNRSIYEVLGATDRPNQVANDGLFNPMAALLRPRSRGTLTYKGAWNLFDQIILSEDLITAKQGLAYVPKSAHIHNPDFLQVGFGKGKDNPRRAIFRGHFEAEGFSDHFPVYLKLVVQ